jgi:putative copper export protein
VSVERQARPLLLPSVGLFVATGAFLLLADDQSEGIGNFFASTWTTLMLAKHGLIVVMVVLAGIVDFLVSEVSYAETDLDRDRLMGRLGLATEATTGVGALVVLLTAVAQVA